MYIINKIFKDTQMKQKVWAQLFLDKTYNSLKHKL